MIVCIYSMTPSLHASSLIIKSWALCTRWYKFTSFSSNNISQLFTLSTSILSYSTRHNKLYLSYVNSPFGGRLLKFKGSQLWNRLPKDLINIKSHQLLSVQCNTLHGTEYKITSRRVCECVCVRTGLWGPISRKGLEIGAWSQWETNRKWGMGSPMFSLPLMSRDLERSRSWPNYV